jgi:hypothetical protein
MDANNMKSSDMISLVWTAVMEAVDWNKKADLVGDQALKQIHHYARFLAGFTATEKAQVTLMNRIQGYCYDNQNLLKSFSKMVMMLYQRAFAVLSDGWGVGASLYYYYFFHFATISQIPVSTSCLLSAQATSFPRMPSWSGTINRTAPREKVSFSLRWMTWSSGCRPPRRKTRAQTFRQ